MPTITPDTTPSFPVVPNYGYTSSPQYRIDAVELEGGYEKVNQLWPRPLLFITAAPLDDAEVEEMEQVLAFYHAVAGMSKYFRMRDHVDYQSVGIRAVPAFTDQPLTEIGSTGTYQLVKNYVSGGLIQVREIYKPIGDTISVGNEVAAEQSDWTLDEANGVLTPGGTFTGTPTTWGGEFDVEVRFTSELQMEASTFGTHGTRLSMREKRRVPTT